MEQTASYDYIKRHNLFYFRNEIRRKIITRNDSERNRELEELWNEYPQVPAICARQSQESRDGWVDAGISFPARNGKIRKRFAIRVPAEEIWGVQTPWEVVDFGRLPQGRYRDALEYVALRKRGSIRLGAFGSAALQIATELPYLDEGSDIDLIIEGGKREDLEEFRRLLVLACEKTGVSFDVELKVGRNHYVKFQELFSGTGTVLAKSETDVKLLEIQEIWEALDA